VSVWGAAEVDVSVELEELVPELDDAGVEEDELDEDGEDELLDELTDDIEEEEDEELLLEELEEEEVVAVLLIEAAYKPPAATTTIITTTIPIVAPRLRACFILDLRENIASRSRQTSNLITLVPLWPRWPKVRN
jgi:hypothetical protein